MKQIRDVCHEYDGLTLIHQNQPGMLLHEHTHASHEVLIPIEGQFRVNIADKSWRVTPSEMFWIPNGTAHSFSSVQEKHGERLILLFDENIWRKWNGSRRGATLFPCHQLIKELSFYLVSMSSKHSCAPLVDVLFSIVSDVLKEHPEVIRHAEHNHFEPVIHRALEALAARFTEDLSIEDISAFAGTSSRNLTRLFSRYVGISPKQVLIKYRIQEACRLLRESKLSITDIAYESGFGSLSRFIEAFRSHVGLLPSDYRAQASNPTRSV